jgi:ribonuclease G
VRQARQFDAKELRVHAAKKVIEMLQTTESQSLENLAEFIGKPISLQIEDQYGQDAFNIILIENRQKLIV